MLYSNYILLERKSQKSGSSLFDKLRMLTTCNSTSSTIATNDDVSTTPQFDTLSNSTESIDILPDELKLEILKNLLQYEYVNLLRVSKSWHRLVFPLLYDHIIIDANFSTFNNICP